MEKKRINKLVVPLTIKSLSVLGAFTVMTSSLAGCKSNKKTSSDNSSSIITSSSEDTVVDNNSEEIEINSSSNDESVTASIDSKPNSNTNNNQSKSNTPKPSTGNKNNTTNNNNQQPNQNNNNNNNNTQPSQGESSNSETPTKTLPSSLTADNINNIEVFNGYATKLNEESFPGVKFPDTLFSNYSYYYEDKLYKTNGKKEMQFILAMLNYKYLSSETLTALFNSDTLDDLKRYGFFMNCMIDIIRQKNITYNFDKYSVDKNFGNYIAQNQEEYLKFITRKSNNFEELAKQYVFEKGNYHYNQGNFFYDNFLVLSIKLSDVQLNDFKTNYQVNEIYSDVSDNYKVLINDIYDYSHGKVKKISK